MEGSVANPDLPENLRNMIEHIGVVIPENVDDTMKAIAERGAEGRCMCCESPLGRNTVLVIKTNGIILTYCGGHCMTDHAVSGWLEEQYDDLAQRVKFRHNNQGDRPEGED